jgi:hypothetical protein
VHWVVDRDPGSLCIEPLHGMHTDASVQFCSNSCLCLGSIRID